MDRRKQPTNESKLLLLLIISASINALLLTFILISAHWTYIVKCTPSVNETTTAPEAKHLPSVIIKDSREKRIST